MYIEITSIILDLYYSESNQKGYAYYKIKSTIYHECFDLIDIYLHIKRFDIQLFFPEGDINLLNLKYYI
jgi:hypothetical protein